jgi:hypothetical protein
MGGVKLKVSIAQDGSAQVVEVVSGPEMLKKAAIESAKGSTFQPPIMAYGDHLYDLTYVFELKPLECGEAGDSSYPRISHDSNIVTVSVQAPPICCLANGTTSVRSPKCLYLWKCGHS